MRYSINRWNRRAMCALFAGLAFGVLGCSGREQPSVVEPAPSLLVDAQWTRAHASDSNLVLVHIGHAEMAGMPQPADAHELIPGSVELDYMAMTRNVGTPEVYNELPERDSLARLIGNLGITNESRVVVYSRDPIMAARAFMTFESAGLRDVHFLNGGVAAWKGAGGTTTTAAAVPTPRPPFAVTVDDSVVVSAEWVREHLDDPNVALVDTRTTEEYQGEGERHGIRTVGHLPGAHLLVWETLMVPQDSTMLRPHGELVKLLADAGGVPGKTVVTYCHLGYRASLSYMVARVAGLRARLYDGSYNEWAARDLPLVKGTQPR